MADNLLQPLWSYLTDRWGFAISYWLFPALVGLVAYVGIGIYFTLKDIGPWRSEATHIHKGEWPTKKELFQVAGKQIGIYVLLNLLLWYAFPHHVELPAKAPTVWELLRDISISLLVSDFLAFLQHVMMHKIRFLYTRALHSPSIQSWPVLVVCRMDASIREC